MADNRKTVSWLLQKLAGTLSLDEAGGVIVFGSSAIVLHGVDLGRPVNDLDIFVSDASFDRLSLLYPVKETSAKEGGKIPCIEPVGGAPVEILKSFPGVIFDEVAERAIELEGSLGLKIGSLSDLRSWKTAQGRDKDLADVGAIDNFSRLQGPPS